MPSSLIAPSSADLIAFRAQRGWSQHDLARELGYHHSTISLWECDKRRIPPRLGLALNALAEPRPENVAIERSGD